MQREQEGISLDGRLQPDERTSGHPGKAWPSSGDKLFSDPEDWQEVALGPTESGHSGRSPTARYMVCGSRNSWLSYLKRELTVDQHHFWAECCKQDNSSYYLNTCQVLDSMPRSLLAGSYLILKTNARR